MVSVRYGGKTGPTYELSFSEEYLVVRTRRRNALSRARLTRKGQDVLSRLDMGPRFAHAGVQFVRARDIDARDARMALKDEGDLQFPGRALCDPASGSPIA